MPGLTVIRPADANETAAAWKQAVLSRKNPTLLVLTRQKLPILDRTKLAAADNLQRGAYVLKDCAAIPDILLIATGSEVSITLDAANLLEKDGIQARVVSMPSTELFEQQDQAYKEKILPSNIRKRLVVEAASSFSWHKYVGSEGDILSIDDFGASAPGEVMMQKFGFTPKNIVKRALKIIERTQ